MVLGHHQTETADLKMSTYKGSKTTTPSARGKTRHVAVRNVEELRLTQPFHHPKTIAGTMKSGNTDNPPEAVCSKYTDNAILNAGHVRTQ